MRGTGWPDDDVAGSAFDGFIADPDQDAALEDDEGLVVGMLMQLGSLATTASMHSKTVRHQEGNR